MLPINAVFHAFVVAQSKHTPNPIPEEHPGGSRDPSWKVAVS